MNFKIWIKGLTAGKLKVWYYRVTQPLSIVQFIMVAYLVISTNMLFLWVMPCIVLAIPVYLYFDIKHILPSESNYATEKTPIIMGLVNDVAEIKSILNEMKYDKRFIKNENK
jgi:hypothetical protein